MSDKTELEPCPFCGPQTDEGKRVVLLEERETDGFVRGYTVRCDNCGVEHNGEYEHDAIAAWNRRAASPAPADLTGTAASLAEMIDAMDRYQQAVDTDAPADHRAMMERARKALSAARAAAPAGGAEGASLIQRLRNRTIMVNHGHGDVRDEPDADCAAAAEALQALAVAVDGDDPEMPTPIRPLAWLKTLLVECNAPEVLAALGRDDPDAMLTMLNEVQRLHDGLAAALRAAPASPTPTPTAQGQDPLGKVRQAIADYHYALDTRRHAGAWAEITLETIRDALDMPWVQGAELARRSSAPSTSAGEA